MIDSEKRNALAQKTIEFFVNHCNCKTKEEAIEAAVTLAVLSQLCAENIANGKAKIIRPN